MDEYIRKLERSGLDSFDIISRLFEGADEKLAKELKTWASFLQERTLPPFGERYDKAPLSERKDDDIKRRVSYALDEPVNNSNQSNLLNEGVYRGIKIFASVECCEDADCEICHGKNIVYTKKQLFPTRRVYVPGEKV